MAFGISGTSDTYLASARQYEPEGIGVLGWLGQAARAPVDIFRKDGGLSGDIAAAADRDAINRRLFASGNIAETEFFDGIIKKVKSASGVNLENPAFAVAPLLAERIRRASEGQSPSSWRDDIVAKFMDRVRELKQQYPRELEDIDTELSPQEQISARIDLEKNDAGRVFDETPGNPVLKGASWLGGEIWAMRRDPLSLGSLFLGGSGTGATLAARVGTAAARNAGVNAGVAAAMQPALYDWNKKLEQPYGIGEAVADIALAGLAGGLFGGALQGGAEAARLLRPRAAKVFLSDEDKAAMRGAKAFGDAHDEILKAPPGVSRETAARTYPDALAHLDEPLEPPPLGEPVAGRDELYSWGLEQRAQQILDEAGDLDTAVRALRDDPDLLDAAQFADNPDLRMAGRLARLSDEALEAMRGGAVDPVHASAVGAMADNPDHQAALVGLLAEQKPVDGDAARVMVRDWQAAEASVRANRAQMGLHGDPQEMARALAQEFPPVIDLLQRGELSLERIYTLRDNALALERQLFVEAFGEKQAMRFERLLKMQNRSPAASAEFDAMLNALPEDQQDVLLGFGWPKEAVSQYWDDVIFKVDFKDLADRDVAISLNQRLGELPDQMEWAKMTDREQMAVIGVDRALAELSMRGVNEKEAMRLAFGRSVELAGNDVVELFGGQMDRYRAIRDGAVVMDDAAPPARPARVPLSAEDRRPRPAAAAGEAALAVEPGSMRDAVPMPREDGTVRFVSRAELAEDAARPKFLAELVAGCQL